MSGAVRAMDIARRANQYRNTRTSATLPGVDTPSVRERIEQGKAVLTVLPLDADELPLIAWSGSALHLEHVAKQLERVASGDVDYLALRVDGVPVAKGGIDYAVEPGAGTIWQVATHPELEGLGLATRLVRACEERIAGRGLSPVRLSVELDNTRARRLYEYLGYQVCGETPDEWEDQDAEGNRFIYRTTCAQMVKHV